MKLIDNMEEVSFSKGDYLVRAGETNSSYYLIKDGIWRGYILRDGEELSVWFAITEERIVATGSIPQAKERYLDLLKRDPLLLKHVPLKYIASYLFITPQSLSRIRAELAKEK